MRYGDMGVYPKTDHFLISIKEALANLRYKTQAVSTIAVLDESPGGKHGTQAQ